LNPVPDRNLPKLLSKSKLKYIKITLSY
jgi:hypothetical protein